jgi:3-oxoacyl-[acyl-carrier-protein] synthase-3
MSGPKIIVSALEHALGQQTPIDTIEALARDEKRLSTLRRHGLENFRRSEEPPHALAAESARKTLAAAGLSPRDIDGVVYATTSLERREWYTVHYGKFAEALGLTAVTPIGIFLSDCANVATALTVARGLIAAGSHRRILLVTVDVFPDDAARMRNQLITINGDGAATAIVSAEVSSGFELLGICQVSNQAAWSAPDLENRFMMTIRGVKQAASGLCEQLAMSAHDFDALVTNNYHRHCLNMLALQSGVPTERLFDANVAAYAHLSASDNLINLGRYASEHKRSGARIMSLTTGIATWAAMGWQIV